MKKVERASGVLANISSLPSKYGIGCFSSDAKLFVDKIADAGFSWWQILPLTAIGAGNSPYSGESTFAGNSLYICPEWLAKKGLIAQSDLPRFFYHGSQYQVDYDFAKENSRQYLSLAFSNIDANFKQEMQSFKDDNPWVVDYALFKILSDKLGNDFAEWSDDIKFRNATKLEQLQVEFQSEIEYYVFEQFCFFSEWSEIKKYANDKGILIFGDLPFYVSTHSSDVWANSEYFWLDQNLERVKKAGVPPDAFSKTGQIWGNALYDFDKMKTNDYAWWRARIKHCFEMYDVLRLDHFRAFYNYFAIPTADETAENGEWMFAPGAELLDKIKADNPNGILVAEDLGELDADCKQFVKDSGLLTMRVFQFAFDGFKSIHLPHFWNDGVVGYTGTHDNNTTLGWLGELWDDCRRFVLKYVGTHDNEWWKGGTDAVSTPAIAKCVIASSASVSILPLQDMLFYGTDTRMNTPGVADGNWKFRVSTEQLYEIKYDFFRNLNCTYGRVNR